MGSCSSWGVYVMSVKSTLVMVEFLQMASNISSLASARAVNSETIDAAILEMKPFSALGSFAKGVSVDVILSWIWVDHCIRENQLNNESWETAYQLRGKFNRRQNILSE